MMNDSDNSDIGIFYQVQQMIFNALSWRAVNLIAAICKGSAQLNRKIVIEYSHRF